MQWNDDFGHLLDRTIVYHDHEDTNPYTVLPSWPIERCFYRIAERGFKIVRIDISDTPLMQQIKREYIL